MSFQSLRSAARGLLPARLQVIVRDAGVGGAREALPASDPSADPQPVCPAQSFERAEAQRSPSACSPSAAFAHPPTLAVAADTGEGVSTQQTPDVDHDFEAAFAAWGSLLNVPGILLSRPALACALGPEGFAALLRDDPAALAALALPQEHWGELLLVAATLKTPRPSVEVADWMGSALANAASVDGVAPASLGEKGVRALGDAISQRQSRLALGLLRAGVDPNGANEDGESLLAIACSRGVEEFVGLLLHAGADPCRGARSGLEAAAAYGDRATVSRMRTAMGSKGFAFDVALRAHRLAAANGFAAMAAALVPDCEAAATVESANAAERDEKLGRLHAEGFVAFCRSMEGALAARQALSFLSTPDVLARGLEAAVDARRWTTARAVMDGILGAESLGANPGPPCGAAAGPHAVAGDFLGPMKLAAHEAALAPKRDLDDAGRAQVEQAFARIAIDCLQLTLRDPSLAAKAEQAVANARNECPALSAWMERRALQAEAALEGLGAVAAGAERRPATRRALSASASPSARRL